jgi:glyoxylase-like metal-dependent hydrolase (beta-lactamase superfamily II)
MNIYTLDLNFQNVPQTIASYLIVGPQGPVLVETGPGSTLATLQSQLALHGFATADVRHVLVTHIHLDHAGAAGWWASQGAQVYVHPFGAPHLINPERLLKSANLIYGDRMKPLWGDFLAAPADKVTVVQDGDVIDVAGLHFEVIETPGHARHHHVYRLEDVAFTGDTAGILMPGRTLVDVPAPPPEFDLEAWQTSLTRLIAENFQTIYPTHFGPVTAVEETLTELKELLQDTTSFVKEQMRGGLTRDELVTAYNEWNRQRAREAGLSEATIRQYEVANPWYMSVDGIMRYWRKREEQG